MILIIKTILQKIVNDIDSGNSNVSESEQKKIVDFLYDINREDLSKLEAADFIGVSRATFDNYVNKGLLPKGLKRRGFKELSWNKIDLIKFKENKHD